MSTFELNHLHSLSSMWDQHSDLQMHPAIFASIFSCILARNEEQAGQEDEEKNIPFHNRYFLKKGLLRRAELDRREELVKVINFVKGDNTTKW